MTSFLTYRNAPYIALLLSGSLLIGAWVFQYGFGYAPCTMCYWQRHAHKVIIGLSLLAIIIRRGADKPALSKLMLWLIILGFLSSAALAFYHVGVEYKWWEGPKTCSGGTGNLTLPEIDPNDPLAIFDKPIHGPSCTDAVWHFIGLSMAAWNAIISFGGAVIMMASRKR